MVGFSGCVFALQAFEDIYTSKCVDYMSVPRNATELKEFLENGELITTLLAIVVSISVASEFYIKQLDPER